MVYFFLFILGGFCYTSMELIGRGRTHWSMFIVGAIAVIGVGLLNEYKFKWGQSFISQCVIGGLWITLVEFGSGTVINLILKWNVWDYSDLAFNILGQVCIPFTLLWMVLSALAIVFDDWVRYWYYLTFGGGVREKPHYRLL